MHADADNDLLLVRELRKMSSLSKRGEKIAPRAADEQLKWLDWPDFVQVQQALSCLVDLLHGSFAYLHPAPCSCSLTPRALRLEVASKIVMWGTGGLARTALRMYVLS
jgi:hypothetical protein